MDTGRKLPGTLFIALLFIAFFDVAFAGEAAGDKNLQATKPTVLVFGLGPRCRFCAELKEDIGEVKKKIGDAVQFQDVLVDQDKRMVQKYRIVLSPTLVFLDSKGKEVFRFQGVMNAGEIEARLGTLGFVKPAR